VRLETGYMLNEDRKKQINIRKTESRKIEVK
jgi:hypothetical protein